MAAKTVFISYSHTDEKWLKRLKKCLNPFLAGTEIEVWDDSQIPPGREWLEEIRSAIYYSCAVVLLISPKFLASEFITKHELPLFLVAADEGGLIVLWIPIKDSQYQTSWISTYQSLYPSNKPLNSLRPPIWNKALDQICKRIVKAVASHPPLPFQRQPRSGEPQSIPPRMFSKLRPALFKEADLEALARGMEMNIETDPKSGENCEDNTGISAGYTFLGEFIDHDITFPQLTGVGERYRPPFFGDYAPPFNLHGVYGHGPHVQPYLYHPDGLRMRLGDQVKGNEIECSARQILRMSSDGRESASALIGDSRNDGNIIISQLHSMMLRFHNRVADLLRSKSFSEIQQVVRFHYQWIVIHDFLETIIGTETLRSILPHLAKGSTLLQDPPQLRLYTPRQQGGIPIEFSLAVFRFGHSMLRPSYRLNAGVDPLPFFSAISPHGSLMGGRAWPPGWSIDWNFFFKMSTDPERCESKRVQYSYKIDTSIVNLLSDLPGHSPMHSLTLRNLLRGLRTGLPSGQAVSTDMKITSISDDRLTVGKATERDTPHNKPLVSFSRRFKSNAPLWYYILAEAQQQFVNDDSPIRLGPVGGRIVGEVLIGLMLANSNSFLRQDPLFRPLEALRSAGGQFRMADLLGHALQA